MPLMGAFIATLGGEIKGVSQGSVNLTDPGSVKLSQIID